MVKKQPDGRWLVDVRPQGQRGPRLRRLFDTRREALAFERQSLDEAKRGRSRAPLDRRRLRDLVDLWYQLHGVALRSGEYRRGILYAICGALGNPLISEFTVSDFVAYRARRLASGIAASTLNNEQGYIRAVFLELRRLGQWSGVDPLSTLRRLPVVESELSFLSRDEVARLLAALEGRRDAYHIARLCLATGARWSEAERLRAEHVGFDRVTFTHTKSGKNRTVPLDPAVCEELRARASSGRVFRDSYGCFRGALSRAGVVLPPGQRTHVLRHTFASVFVQRGGSILVLQRILGHSTVLMTMRYSHLAPDHLEQARALNPLVVDVIGTVGAGAGSSGW